MPARIGYGASGANILRDLYRQGAKGVGRLGTRLHNASNVAGIKGWGGAIGGDIAMHTGRGLKGLSRMSDTGMLAATGAGLGGMYGAVADDTSVLGGALMGAGAAYGHAAARHVGLRGLRTYSRLRARGVGAGAAAAGGARVMGRTSSRFIGKTAQRGYNSFKGMYGRFLE